VIHKRKAVVHVLVKREIITATVLRMSVLGSRVKVALHDGSSTRSWFDPADVFSNKESAEAARYNRWREQRKSTTG
jgi:DNA-directed RNA polymerase subunit E'/Rpb7